MAFLQDAKTGGGGDTFMQSGASASRRPHHRVADPDNPTLTINQGANAANTGGMGVTRHSASSEDATATYTLHTRGASPVTGEGWL